MNRNQPPGEYVTMAKDELSSEVDEPTDEQIIERAWAIHDREEPSDED